jgi:S-adenosylmethionine:tRNA ribosyltransferase-isomerase
LSLDSRLSSYDYDLPEELIAQTPLEVRSSSRLLSLDRGSGAVEHLQFEDVLGILRAGDLLVMNDTRVTARRLMGTKPTGGEVEALLLRDLGAGVFEALVKPARRLQVGARVLFSDGLSAVVEGVTESGGRVLRFDPDPDLALKLERSGKVPLPPYITAELDDPERYQTVIARAGGSAAAPTAGLHFTRELLSGFAALGVEMAMVTLDVGIDTFRPVQAEQLEDHQMHGERCEVSEEVAAKVAACEGQIVAVGTTTVRTLESRAVGDRRLEPGTHETKIFIRPGYRFQIVDGMFTNFHLPRTTMLMMLAAMVGREPLMRAYEEAVRQKYRFLSFGDSMLIL